MLYPELLYAIIPTLFSYYFPFRNHYMLLIFFTHLYVIFGGVELSKVCPNRLPQ